jgi:hypothetical protein
MEKVSTVQYTLPKWLDVENAGYEIFWLLPLKICYIREDIIPSPETFTTCIF